MTEQDLYEDGHYDLEEPMFVYVDDVKFDRLSIDHLLRRILQPRQLYIATKCMVYDHEARKRYYGLMGIEEYIDGEILLKLTPKRSVN
jgi:hypothetical protein